MQNFCLPSFPLSLEKKEKERKKNETSLFFFFFFSFNHPKLLPSAIIVSEQSRVSSSLIGGDLRSDYPTPTPLLHSNTHHQHQVNVWEHWHCNLLLPKETGVSRVSIPFGSIRKNILHHFCFTDDRLYASINPYQGKSKVIKKRLGIPGKSKQRLRASKVYL